MNMPLERPIVFIDLETTGVNPSNDRIVEITVLKVRPDGSEEEKTVRVNPEMPIPSEATRVHGITDDDVAALPAFSRYAKSLQAFVEGCDLAGFNAIRFDLPVLRAEFARVGMELDLGGRNVIDPMVIFHQMEPRDLVAAYKRYCDKTIEDAHTSLADVRAAREILEAQVSHYPELGNSMESLHAFCHQNESDWLDDEGKLVDTADGPKFGFGKYRGMRIEEIYKRDPEYLGWVMSSDFTDRVKQVIREVMNLEGES